MPRWSGGTITLDQGEVTNAAINSDPANAIDADKLQPYIVKGTNFAKAIGETPVTSEGIVHVVTVAGRVRGFHALLNDTGSATSITFDLKKNGVSVLSAVITITHSTGDKAVQDATISTPTLAADDILSISMTVSTSTGAQGAYAWVVIEEDNAGT